MKHRFKILILAIRESNVNFSDSICSINLLNKIKSWKKIEVNEIFISSIQNTASYM